MEIDIKERLDELVEKYNTVAFIEHDPVQFPRRYSKLQDIEITASLIGTISWGNRASILKSADKLLSLMHHSPFDYIMNGDYRELGNKNIHRTFFEYDLYYMCHGLHDIYEKHDSIEEIFCNRPSLWDGINSFRTILCEANHKDCKHISNPLSGSACKRLHMILRWLVQQDKIVDLGVWKNISPADLFIPLDTHVARISREFGLLSRKMNDRKAVIELTDILKQFNPEDPVIYDFALFGLGEDTK